MKTIKCTLVLLFALSLSNSLHAQTQIGDLVFLQEFFGRAGKSVSMNESGTRIAIGQPRLSGQSSISYAEVFDFNGTSWVSVGSRLQSVGTAEEFGNSISMNADGTRFVVGAPKGSVNGADSGYVKIYEYQDTGGGVFDWVEIGYFQGDPGDEFGTSVSINAAGDVIAVGSPNDDDGFSNAGSVQVFIDSNGTWEPYTNIFGSLSNIQGSAVNQHIGLSVRLNEMGDEVILRGNNKVEVYENSTSIVGNWQKMGSDIAINAYEELNGLGLNFLTRIHQHESTLGISSSNNRIVVGDPYADINGVNNAGRVRVYEFVNNDWQQVGQDVEGTNTNSRLGHAVGIATDGGRIIVGNQNADGSSDQIRRVYDYDGNSWNQYGNNLDVFDNNNSLVTPFLHHTYLNRIGNISVYGVVTTGYVAVFRVSGQPVISTENASEITPFVATATGNIENDGREDITERGFVYSTTNATPEIGGTGVNQVVNANTEIGMFSNTFENLTPGTLHYFRAYASNLHGTAYGDVLTFTTVDGPAITTSTPTHEGSFATLGGTITEDAGGTITERGVIYSTSSSNLELGEVGVNQQVIQSSNATFSQMITNLSFATQYYTRAYFILDIGGTLYTIYGSIENFTTLSSDSSITFLGTVDSDWSNPANWDLSRLPNSSDNVVINSQVVINSSEEVIVANIQANRLLTIEGKLSVNSLTVGNFRVLLSGDLTVNVAINLTTFSIGDLQIQDGGSFILHGSFSGGGLINYYRTVTPNEWFLMCSPFADNTIFEYLDLHNTVTSSGTNHAYAPYNNSNTGTADVWDYIQTSEIPTMFPPNFNPPHILDQVRGYGSSISDGSSSRFIGTPEEEDISISINTGSVDSYNLVGNPYPSYLDANALLSTNSSILEEQTLWTWDESTETYRAYNLINSYEIPPTTGFFVQSTANGGTFSVTESMQMHDTNNVSIHPQIELSVTDGTQTKTTNVYYSNNGTTGLDNGYDSSLIETFRPEFPENLTPDNLKLYTALVSDQVSEKLMIQTVPNSNHETMIVPIGVEATSGTTLTFNASSFNFTTPVFIEDREEGTFHPLNINNSYEVTLTSDLNGVGRFYVRLDQVYPVLTTTFDNVDDSFATLGGTIEESGNSTITERGVIYATSNTNLQIGQSGVLQQVISSTQSVFSQQVFSLSFETTYYVRSYIITDEFNIVYGPEESFTTLPEDTSTITFLGSVDNDWSNAANWDLNRLPNSSDNAVINSQVLVNASTEAIAATLQASSNLNIEGKLTVNSLTLTGSSSINLLGDLTVNVAINLPSFVTNDLVIQDGGSFILNGSFSGGGLLNYYRAATPNKWFLMCSPFADNTIFEYLDLHNTVTSSGTNHAYAPYNNSYTGTADVWDYIQTSEIPTDFPPNFNPPHILDQVKGYGSSIASGSSVRFIGTPEEEDISIPINTGSADSYNLVGNPYPSYLNANALLSTNSSILEEQTLWTWDESTETYRAYNLINSYEIPPTTGFFVQSTANGGTFNVTESMQMHDSNSISAHPQIELSVTNGTGTKITNIYYSNIATTGFDNGYDSNLFDGYRPDFPENLTPDNLKLYSALVSDQASEKLMIQTLPNSNHETMIVPIGVEASSGTTLTFKASSFNFTTPVFLEDREEGTFHLLSDGSSYEVTLSETLTGLGRFYLRTNFTQGELTNTWLGGSTDWNSKSNWSLSFVPIETVNVVIPNNPLYGMNYPVINEDISINKLELSSGSSLTVNGAIANNDTIVVNSGASLIADSASGLITYKRFLPEDNWFMISSPVEGLTIEDFIAANNLASGNGNVGLQEFDPATGWSIFQSNSTGSMNNGQGYAVRLPQAGEISFTGSLPSSDSSIDIQQGAYSFNLIGNPFPSYIPINSNALQSLNILNHNSEELSEMTIWIWDQSMASYKTINQSSDPYFLSPGQGFFVSSNSGPSSFGINRGIQGHQEDVFFRTSATNSSTKIALSITDNTSTRSTEVYFGEGSTRGFDNGYDSSHIGFLPDELAIFTHLLEDNEGNSYAIQTLPFDDVENIEIPVGVNSVSGVGIDFTAEVRNLPNGVMLYLEDRDNNTFTRLDEDNSVYSIALENGSEGVGRFYLHTSTEVLSNSSFEDNLPSVSLFMVEDQNLRITGLLPYETQMKMYNIQGQQIFQTTFLGKETNTIKIPATAAGIYMIKLKFNGNVLNKKLLLD